MEPFIIWIQERPLIICEQLQDIPEIVVPASSRQSYLCPEKHPDFSALIHQLQQGDKEACIIQSSDQNALFDHIVRLYVMREAAGGLITNAQQDVLLIFRLGKWDLPKGKIEPGDNPQQTALREVREETGLHQVSIEQLICHTYHAYTDRYTQEQVLKKTHWFKMQFTGTELTVPQIEEDILDVQWIKPAHVEKYLRYSYGTVRYVFYRAGYPISVS